MPTLLLRAIEGELLELARAKKLDGARVGHRVNARGELVVALILPPSFAEHAEEITPRPRKYPDPRR